MADNNYTDVSTLLNENQSSNTSNDNGSINDNVDGPVENKFNEFTSYWDPLKEEFVMSTDTPTVQIFISREIVPEHTEEADEIEVVNESLVASYDMSVAYQNPTIDEGSFSVVNTKRGPYIVMNAVNKHD